MALTLNYGRNIGRTYQQIVAMHHALNLNLSVVIIGLKEPNVYISELSKLGTMAVAEYLEKDNGYLFRLANKEEKQTVTDLFNGFVKLISDDYLKPGELKLKI